MHAMSDAFCHRHVYVLERLRAMPEIQVMPADGTFYIFPQVTKVIQRRGFKNDVDFAEHLLNEQGLAVVPGSAFGCEGSIRLSFAIDQSTLEDAMDRLERFVNS